MTLQERFLRYVKINTTSDENGQGCPSAACEWELARLLADEMRAMGVSNVRLDAHAYVYGEIPANCEHAPAIGLIAHMDTVDAVPGRAFHPRVVEYQGGDICLNAEKGIVLSEKDFPELSQRRGKHLIVTDGTTVLGADDKAGVAEIMTLCERVLQDGSIRHGKICIGFTPDEEIGSGADLFDVPAFGADFAYTLDGGDITDYEYETFNAAKTVVTINGFSIHPGTSKDKMRNALLIAMEYNALLPALETPAHTEGYEGFFHLQEMHGKAEKATMEYIVRDHDMKRFQERKAMMDKAAEQINRRWGDGTAVVDTHDQYYNMYEVLKDHMEILELAESAMKAAGIEHPTHSPIRGGTDGSVLTYKGLLCPNLPSAGHNAHGRYEYAPVESLKTGVKTVKALVSPELVETIIGKKEG